MHTKMPNGEYWHRIEAIRETEQIKLVDESKSLTEEERNNLKIGSLTLLSEIFEDIKTNDPRILVAPESDIQTHENANMTGVRLRWGIKLDGQDSVDESADYSWIEAHVYGARSLLAFPYLIKNGGKETKAYVRFHLATFVKNPFLVLPTVSNLLDYPFRKLFIPSQLQELPPNVFYLFPDRMHS